MPARQRRITPALAALAIPAALVLLAAPALAADVPVTSTADAGPGSLRQAIADAAPGSTIVVPAGTYQLTSGELAVAKTLTIRGAGAATTTITAGGASRVFAFTGAGATELAELTITGGRAAVPGGFREGGGILADNASPLVLRGVRLTGNEVDVRGASGPGGVGTGGGIATKSSLTLIETVVSGNAVLARGGPANPGGIGRGGGIAAQGSAATTVTLTDSALDANTVNVDGGPNNPGGIAEGGGLQAGSAAVTVTRSAVTRSVVTANTTGTGAGGITKGGGIFAGGAFSATNLTVSGNSVDAGAAGIGGVAKGGGLHLGGTAALVHATVAANRAIAGGTSVGIVAGGNIETGPGPVTVTSSIISAGVAPAGTENCSAPVTSGGTNVENLSQCGFTGAGDRAGTDPLLAALADNGGRSLTHALLPGSPALDTAAAGTCPQADQRGTARPQFAGCDVGAFELAPAPPPAPAPAPAPPAPPAPKPAPRPAVFGAAGIVSGAPGTKACLSRRAFTIRIRRVAGVTITSASVLVNGRRVAVRSGKRLTAPVNLRKLPKGRYTVKITVKLADGRTLTGTRRYRTCTPKRKAGRRAVA
jgi:hypothetical protein